MISMAIAQRSGIVSSMLGSADEEHLDNQTARPNSYRGTWSSAPDQAFPAAPMKDHHGNRVLVIHFVQDEDGIVGLCAAQTCMICPGQSSNVCATMARISARHARRPARAGRTSSPAHGRCCAQRSLATPGGPTSREIGPFMLGFSRRTGEVIQNTVFYFFQIVVVCVQHLGGFDNVYDNAARLGHGKTASHSIYCGSRSSPAWGDMRANRLSSLVASFFTSSGMPAASIFCRNSSTSRWVSSCSPVLSGWPSSARADVFALDC